MALQTNSKIIIQPVKIYSSLYKLFSFILIYHEYLCSQFLFSTSYFQNNLQILFKSATVSHSTWVFLSKSNRLEKATRKKKSPLCPVQGDNRLSMIWLWFSGGSPVIALLSNNCILRRHLSTLIVTKFYEKTVFTLIAQVSQSGIILNLILFFVFFSGEDD